MVEKRIEDLEDAAIAFAVLGMLIYEEPTFDRIQTVLDEGFFSEVPFVDDTPEIARGLELLKEWSEQASEMTSEDLIAQLASEWFKLFIGIGTPLAPPWASFYREKDPVLFSKHTLEVRTWYARYGLELERKYQEPDDHIGLILQFFSLLVSRECEALKEGESELAHVFSGEQDTFLHTCVFPWVEVWQHKVMTEATGLYYRGLSLLTVGMLSSYALRFAGDNDLT